MSDDQRAVPDDLRGVWARTRLQTGTDTDAPVADTTSWARRLQTSAWHAALCLPASALEGRTRQPLTALSPRQLAALSAQEGFAGITQCESLPEGLVCTWLRRVDYQPPGLQPHAGWMLFDDPDRLIEIGVHDDRHEVWERLPDSTGRYLVLGGLKPDQSDSGARILLAGEHMVQVRPRARRWPRGLTPGYNLADVLLHSPDQAADWLGCEVSFGRWHGGEWTIEHATLPEREGQTEPCAIHRLDAGRARVLQPRQAETWQVIEWTVDTDELA